MESTFPDELPRIVEHRYESFPPLPNHGYITQDQYRHLEERLDLMQSDIQTSHRMLRDLSMLVHRQVQMTLSKNKHRSYSDNSSPTSYHILGQGSPLSNFSGLDPLTLIARDGPEVIQTTVSTYTNVQSAPKLPILTVADSRTASGDKNNKRSSLSLAVPDATLSAQWLSKLEPTNQPNPKKMTRRWTPLPKRVLKIKPLSKILKPTETDCSDDEAVSRRFSVSSVNLAKSQINALLEVNESEEVSVSPEEILSARNLEGEVNRFTIRHDSIYRNSWDLLVIVMIFLDLIFTPLALGFNYTSEFLKAYNVLEPVVFTIDFFVRMFSSYVDEHGNLVSGPKRTVMNYLTSGWAVPDLLSWFPFELFASSIHSDVISFLKIFRLAKVSHLAHKLHSARKAGFVRFVLLLGIVITISHLLTCYWSWVAQAWRSHLQEGVFVPISLFDEYTLCWSLVIGCVNASPPLMYSPIELISVACFMLVGNILQASVFGAVAALIASFDESEAAYSKKIITTLERCRFLGIPDKLTARIRGYYDNLWRETKSISGDADAFIHELSPALICEVKFQLYRDMIRRIPFLSSKTLAPALIEVLILHLRTVIYMQDDVLIRKDEFGDWMGFIGSKGSVGVLDPNSQGIKIIRILRKGDYFGEMALLQHTKRSATTVALTWVQIHVLCRQDLDYVKELYPTQAEILEKEITKYKRMQLGIERCVFVIFVSFRVICVNCFVSRQTLIECFAI